MRAKDNPFRTSVLESTPYFFPPGDSLEKVLDDFRGLDFRACVVGPMGSGKTRLLEILAPELEALGKRVSYHKIPNADTARAIREPIPPVGDMDADTILLLDGAERLSPRTSRELVKRAMEKNAGLLLATHKPFSLPVLRHNKPTPRTFEALVDYLLRNSRRDIPKETLREIFDRHSGNIRHALLELYDRVH